ncbi:hypothetical protein BAUCODRAFT_516685 [Baudoinia panamericana UAMH 10762]|uniref:Uncharacterized protein n=1 Tax=Baudoinia panamericana (strain UAMH 10762) TaxID=717646 RepID=M2NB41_BAUPA|nr:uncharacterized protein BAUCODRAFT_516685 [Baudoinia panamericana UAMH 10762]EMC96065.1 hypothetical protein BAUCODRAFT_516685 [Baudoinia panamericana UAMH 10762]
MSKPHRPLGEPHWTKEALSIFIWQSFIKRGRRVPRAYNSRCLNLPVLTRIVESVAEISVGSLPLNGNEPRPRRIRSKLRAYNVVLSTVCRVPSPLGRNVMTAESVEEEVRGSVSVSASSSETGKRASVHVGGSGSDAALAIREGKRPVYSNSVLQGRNLLVSEDWMSGAGEHWSQPGMALSASLDEPPKSLRAPRKWQYKRKSQCGGPSLPSTVGECESTTGSSPDTALPTSQSQQPPTCAAPAWWEAPTADAKQAKAQRRAAKRSSWFKQVEVEAVLEACTGKTEAETLDATSDGPLRSSIVPTGLQDTEATCLPAVSSAPEEAHVEGPVVDEPPFTAKISTEPPNFKSEAEAATSPEFPAARQRSAAFRREVRNGMPGSASSVYGRRASGSSVITLSRMNPAAKTGRNRNAIYGGFHAQDSPEGVSTSVRELHDLCDDDEEEEGYGQPQPSAHSTPAQRLKALQRKSAQALKDVWSSSPDADNDTAEPANALKRLSRRSVAALKELFPTVGDATAESLEPTDERAEPARALEKLRRRSVQAFKDLLTSKAVEGAGDRASSRTAPSGQKRRSVMSIHLNQRPELDGAEGVSGWCCPSTRGCSVVDMSEHSGTAPAHSSRLPEVSSTSSLTPEVRRWKRAIAPPINSSPRLDFDFQGSLQIDEWERMTTAILARLCSSEDENAEARVSSLGGRSEHSRIHTTQPWQGQALGDDIPAAPARELDDRAKKSTYRLLSLTDPAQLPITKPYLFSSKTDVEEAVSPRTHVAANELDDGQSHCHDVAVNSGRFIRPQTDGTNATLANDASSPPKKDSTLGTQQPNRKSETTE